jgi:hypothetical protein
MQIAPTRSCLHGPAAQSSSPLQLCAPAQAIRASHASRVRSSFGLHTRVQSASDRHPTAGTHALSVITGPGAVACPGAVRALESHAQVSTGQRTTLQSDAPSNV